MLPGVAYGRSYLARALTRKPGGRRARLQFLLGDGPLMVTGAPPASGLLLCRLRASHVQAWGLVRGIVEPSVQEAMRRHLAPGSRFWDVGANVGFFSLLAARLGATVDAFEPVPENVAALQAGVAANAYGDRIAVHAAAVAEASGSAGLVVVDDPSWSHLADRGNHARTRERIDVDVVALDDLDLPPPDLVKIDVEGSEAAVLRGAQRLLREHRPALVVELHETNAEVCDLLEGHGYVLENLDGPHPPREAGAVHVLARPAG